MTSTDAAYQVGDHLTVTRTDGDHTLTWTGPFGGFTETGDFTLGEHGWFSSAAELARLYGVTQALAPAAAAGAR